MNLWECSKEMDSVPFLKETFESRRIQDLPRPLGLIATNYHTLESVDIASTSKVWFGVRASVSVAGVFPPVKHRSVWLTEGGYGISFPVEYLHSEDNPVIGLQVGPHRLLNPVRQGRENFFRALRTTREIYRTKLNALAAREAARRVGSSIMLIEPSFEALQFGLIRRHLAANRIYHWMATARRELEEVALQPIE